MADFQNQSTDRILGVGALALLVAGCLLVLFPVVTALLLAVILAYSTWPLYVRLRHAVGGRNSVAAALMMVAATVFLLAPFVIVASGLADNAAALMEALRGVFDAGLPEMPPWVKTLPVVGASIDTYWRSLANDDSQLIEEMKNLIAPAREVLLKTGGFLVAGVLQLALSVLVAFFLFRDGDAVAARVRDAASRVAGPDSRRLLDVAGKTVNSVVYGILGTALAQGVLAGIGFLIAGVPGATLLGLGTFFLSVVPVGPPLIWGAATVWLYFQGSVGMAIFMFLWGLLVISLVDNFLKPIIISRGSHLPFILVFLGVLGGILTFGFIGVFLGPTLLAVGFHVLNEWMSRARPVGVERRKNPWP
ncbi:MAG TPA: AI-2E family transporter [Burkholderiales bacterium]|nr:AI-2E family transporter [Burkholderiales bacterium]